MICLKITEPAKLVTTVPTLIYSKTVNNTLMYYTLGGQHGYFVVVYSSKSDSQKVYSIDKEREKNIIGTYSNRQ